MTTERDEVAFILSPVADGERRAGPPRRRQARAVGRGRHIVEAWRKSQRGVEEELLLCEKIDESRNPSNSRSRWWSSWFMVMVSLVTLARRRVRGELWREEESTTVATMAHVCTLSRRLVLRT